MFQFLNNMNMLLFEPRKGVKFTVREKIPLLKVEYSLFQSSLACLITDWLQGKVGSGAPNQKWEQQYIAEVNLHVNGNKQLLDKETKAVYDEMVNIKVPGHLKVATSHRRWIRLTYDFIRMIGVSFSDEMADLVRRHDLSKYTHREVLGYAVMFGDGAIDWRQLQTEAEKMEWNNTLHNHYAGNPHHPEYFYPLQMDGKRDKTVSVMTLDPENGKDFVDESIVDMLAARGERTLAKDLEFNVKKWLRIDNKYFLRYSDEDKLYVKSCLSEYEKLADDFFSNTENAKNIQGFFDERPVVFVNQQSEPI